MTDTDNPLSEQVVAGVLRAQIGEGHLWLEPTVLTENMLIRWFGIPRATARSALRRLMDEHLDQDLADDGPLSTPTAELPQTDTDPRYTASTITDPVLNQLYDEIDRLRRQLNEQRRAAQEPAARANQSRTASR